MRPVALLLYRTHAASLTVAASSCAVAIAISIGIREQSVLASIFMLHFTTMVRYIAPERATPGIAPIFARVLARTPHLLPNCPPWQCYGFLTEYISVPKAMVDTTNYQYPIGPLQVAEFAKAGRLASDIAPYGDGGNTDYRRDPRALKLISQDQWELERPVYDIQDTAKALGKESDYFVQAQRTNNYVRYATRHSNIPHAHTSSSGPLKHTTRSHLPGRRMVPHVLGYFPMTAAWVIMITHLEQARYDLTLITDRTIPEWVDGAVSRMLISPHATTIHDLFALCCTDLRHRHHLLVLHAGTLHNTHTPSMKRHSSSSSSSSDGSSHSLSPIRPWQVQIVYQYMPPGFYWGSELIYCVLSLSAKLYLGFFLLINVIMTDGTVEQSLAPAEGA